MSDTVPEVAPMLPNPGTIEAERLFSTIVIRGVAERDRLAKGTGMQDMICMAYWDGVVRMAESAWDVLAGRELADGARSKLEGYALGLHLLLEREGAE